jgi:branched-chain amino acid transport system substrate-binding protein
MITAGILMPRSTLYPSLGHDWLNGIKNQLKSCDRYAQIKLLTDNIGFGTNEQEIYSRAEKMLLEEDADVVVLFADTAMGAMLSPLFAATNKLLLLVNFGANFPDNWQPGATQITHSLNFCFHTSLTGKLAAASASKEAVNIISYYDAGYRQCFSLLNSYQQKGGVPAFNHITNLKTEEFTLAPVARFLEQNPGVKNVLCMFSGEEAAKFYQEIEPLQQKYSLQLFASPMMLEEMLVLAPSETGATASGYVPWHSSLTHEANSEFVTTTRKNTGKDANYFSLLGWETGILLEQLLMLETIADAVSVGNFLKGKQLVSPGGWIKTDPVTQHTYRPSYLAVRKPGREIVLQDEIPAIDQEWSGFTRIKLLPGESSNWRNTYLCI